MNSCLEIIMSRRIFQNPAGLQSIKICNFADISKILTNTIKVIYLEIKNKNANTYFSTTFQVA